MMRRSSRFSRPSASAVLACLLTQTVGSARAIQTTGPASAGIVFTDVTAAAGIRFKHNSGAFGKKYLPETLGSGCAFLDFDGDGWQDILLVNSRNFPGRPGPPSYPALYRNNRNGTFTDVTLISGTGYNSEGEAEASMGVDASDYDGDGLLDLVATNYDLETNALYRNEGSFQFSDKRWAAGVAKADHRFLGCGTGFFDFDNDGDRDPASRLASPSSNQ